MVKGKQHIAEIYLTSTRDKRLLKFMLQRPGLGHGEQCDET